MEVIGFRAYYVDGAIYTPKTTTLEDLPSDGILGLVVYTSDGKKHRMYGGDYFFVDAAKGKFGIDHGDLSELSLKYTGAVIIRGMWTDDAAMQYVVRRMKVDAP